MSDRTAQLKELLSDMVREGYRIDLPACALECPYGHMDCDPEDGTTSLEVTSPTQNRVTIDIEDYTPEKVAGCQK